MKKSLGIVITIVVIIAVVAGIFIFVGKNGGDSKNLGDLSKFVDKIYANTELELPQLQTTVVDVTDSDMVTNFTAISDTSVVEELVVSEPMMTSSAYSMFILKVKDGTNVESVKQEIKDNLDMRKWICVEAEKLYVNNSGNYIMAVMTTADYAKEMYEQFKAQVNGEVGTLLEREAPVYEFDDEMNVGVEPEVEPGVEPVE